jgi:hypothetical protein
LVAELSGESDDSTNFQEFVKHPAGYSNFSRNFGILAPQHPDTSHWAALFSAKCRIGSGDVQPSLIVLFQKSGRGRKFYDWERIYLDPRCLRRAALGALPDSVPQLRRLSHETRRK